jgi:hypothetical protein
MVANTLAPVKSNTVKQANVAEIIEMDKETLIVTLMGDGGPKRAWSRIMIIASHTWGALYT